MEHSDGNRDHRCPQKRRKGKGKEDAHKLCGGYGRHFRHPRRLSLSYTRYCHTPYLSDQEILKIFQKTVDKSENMRYNKENRDSTIRKRRTV